MYHKIEGEIERRDRTDHTNGGPQVKAETSGRNRRGIHGDDLAMARLRLKSCKA